MEGFGGECGEVWGELGNGGREGGMIYMEEEGVWERAEKRYAGKVTGVLYRG